MRRQAATREEINRLIDEAEAEIDDLQQDLLAFAEAMLGERGRRALSTSITRQERELRDRMGPRAAASAADAHTRGPRRPM